MPDITSIPGLPELWQLTLGDPAIRVAVLDGPARLDHPCLRTANVRRLNSYWIEERAETEDGLIDHATHVCSTIFSPHDTEVKGIAPHCQGFNVAVQAGGMTDPAHIVRAIDAARDAGADIIHVALVQPTQSGVAENFLQQAIKTCLEEGRLVVSPAGNDRGECWTMPSAIPGVLAVGAMRDDGQPFKFSNYGGVLQEQGVLAPGENVLGADPHGGVWKQKGTSCAAPIVTGVAALLMSLQLRQGRKPSAIEVRQAILDSAIPCDPQEVEEPERCLRGKLNIAGAMEIILAKGGGLTASAAPSPPPPKPKSVYALGTIGYDFGTEARRDAFAQRIGADPYNPRRMTAYLAANPDEARALTWTLNQEQTPIYAIKPVGAYGAEAYERLRLLLAGEVEAAGSEHFIDRVSVPGEQTGESLRLLSGEQIPTLRLRTPRGLYGWQVNSLVEEAVFAAAPDADEAQAVALRRALRDFLHHIYHLLKNPGVSSKDRALNFAATNAFQAAQAFAMALAEERELKTMEVVKSPVCRQNSDCWDIKLKFFDSDHGQRAQRVCRFTIDVSDALPVTLGEVRTWLTRD